MATSVVLKELLASRVEPWKRAQKRKYHVRAVPGFHMNRMAATEKPNVAPAVTPSDLQIRSVAPSAEVNLFKLKKDRYRDPQPCSNGIPFETGGSEGSVLVCLH